MSFPKAWREFSFRDTDFSFSKHLDQGMETIVVLGNVAYFGLKFNNIRPFVIHSKNIRMNFTKKVRKTEGKRKREERERDQVRARNVEQAAGSRQQAY